MSEGKSEIRFRIKKLNNSQMTEEENRYEKQ